MRRALQLLFAGVVLAAEAGAVLALTRLGHEPGFALPHDHVACWLGSATTEDLFAVTARLAGLAAAWWLLAATTASVARRVVPGWRRLGALDIATPVALRHALDRVLVIGLGASLALITPAAAGAEEPVVRRPVVATAVTAVATTTTGAPAAGPVVRTPAPPSPPAPRVRPPRRAPVPAPVPASVVVRAGDNLWVITRRALEHRAEPTEQEIAPYWRRVIAANRAQLRSRDPNLIYPGERIVLPPPPVGERPTG